MQERRKCKICEDEFKINSKSHIKTCSGCRKKLGHIGTWKARNKLLTERFNDNFNLLRINRSNGGFNIGLNFESYNLGNSISNLTDKELYKKYLFDCLDKIEKDLILLEGYTFE